MPRPPMSLSYSRLRALPCPFRFEHEYLAETRSRFQSIAALRGTYGHGIAEEYIPHLARKNKRRDYDAFAEIVERHLAGVPYWIAQPVRDTAETFVSVFELDKTAESHQTEILLVVDRDFKPTDEYELDADMHVHATTKDIFTGRIDYRLVKSAARYALLWDFKTGELHSHADAARESWQGQLYCALDFWCNPERERNTFRLWGVKYGRRNVSDWDYPHPETACEPARQRIEQGFARLDALWMLRELGEPFPARDEEAGTCQYCPLPGRCPLNMEVMEELLQREIIVKPRKRKSSGSSNSASRGTGSRKRFSRFRA